MLFFVFSSLILAGLAQAADSASNIPPIPPVVSTTETGTVKQNPDIYGRDGCFSAVVDGASMWTFGDTPLSVPGGEGIDWDDNSLSWTVNFDASQGIYLDHDVLDWTGAPSEFLPYTPEEKQYNYAHDKRHCTAQPCGAEFAMWPSTIVPDPERNRALFFYYELWRVPGGNGWTSVGSGIAVGKPDSVVRPIENPGSQTPTLMWGPNDVAFTNAATVIGDTLYAYGCFTDFLSKDCQVARVPLWGVLDKSTWRYYAGGGVWSTNPADAKTVFQGGAAGTTVFYNAFLGEYVAIYSGVFVNDVYYRVSYTPWGPWSTAKLLFTGKPGWNNNYDYAAQAHPEFAEGDGQTQYVTYVHATGVLRSDIPIVKVVFGKK